MYICFSLIFKEACVCICFPMIQTNKKTERLILPLRPPSPSEAEIRICARTPSITSGVGDIGAAPNHITNDLSSTEKFAGRILAGRAQFTKRLNSIERPYIWVPCYTYTTQLNIFLCIRPINPTDDDDDDAASVPPTQKRKTWRVFDVSKIASSFYDFHSLENARNVFWDMVRAGLIWGNPERKKQLHKMISNQQQ